MNCFEQKDENYWIPKAVNLANCLLKHGWKHSSNPPNDFEPGFPIFFKDYGLSMILCSFDGDSVYADFHYGEELYCNEYAGEKDEFIYYYL